MAQIVQGQNVVEAWQNGCRALLAAPDNIIRNLITEIHNPTQIEVGWLRRYSPQSVGARDSASVVAKVLFPPSGKAATESRAAFYERWNKTLNRGRGRRKLKAPWGTYFGRLTDFDGEINQIENIIAALSNWGIRTEASLLAHTSAPTLDNLRPIGSPCLQYIEVLWSADNTINLVAVYRNHDFLLKALGNFIGLGQLLQFIATESGKTAGTLTCHSVRAYCDAPARLRRLIEQ